MHLSIADLSALIAAIAIIFCAVTALGIVRRETIRTANESVQLYKDNAAALQQKTESQASAIHNLEQRVYLTELSQRRQEHMLKAAQKENEIQERIIALFVRHLSSLDETTRTEADALMRELQRYRVEANAEMHRWEEKVSIETTYLNGVAGAPPPPLYQSSSERVGSRVG